MSLQQTPQPPATTYRPQTVSYVTQRPAHQTTAAFAPQPQQQQGVTFASGSTRGAIDFDAEFKKFQHDNGGFQPITQSPSSQATKSIKIPQGSSGPSGSNPIYQTQLVYNPSSGQYDSALYQSIAQTDSEFQLNQRIQPYVPQYQAQQQQQQQSFQIPQHQQQQTIYRPQPQQAQAQVPQQVYQKQQNELQFVNSQQLFAQQLQMQQSQLHRDRLEASKNQKQAPQAHRFQLQQAEQSPILRAQANGQQFYYLQPQAQQSSGQIDAFLRGHNLEY